jgi:hypothetical protein
MSTCIETDKISIRLAEVTVDDYINLELSHDEALQLQKKLAEFTSKKES